LDLLQEKCSAREKTQAAAVSRSLGRARLTGWTEVVTRATRERLLRIRGERGAGLSDRLLEDEKEVLRGFFHTSGVIASLRVKPEAWAFKKANKAPSAGLGAPADD